MASRFGRPALRGRPAVPQHRVILGGPVLPGRRADFIRLEPAGGVLAGEALSLRPFLALPPALNPGLSFGAGLE